MGKRFLCRTAASFVSALMGIISKPPILPNDIGIARERNGGLELYLAKIEGSVV